MRTISSPRIYFSKRLIARSCKRDKLNSATIEPNKA